MFKYRAETTYRHHTGIVMRDVREFRAWTHDGALTKAFKAFGIFNPQDVYISRITLFGRRRIATIPGIAIYPVAPGMVIGSDPQPCEKFQNGLCHASRCDQAFPRPQPGWRDDVDSGAAG